MSARRAIIDAHQVLACHCQELSRDPVDPGATSCMLTLPWLVRAGVRLICATFFIPHEGSYEQRQAKLEAQYEMYSSWFAQYPDSFRFVHDSASLQSLLAEPQGEHF